MGTNGRGWQGVSRREGREDGSGGSATRGCHRSSRTGCGHPACGSEERFGGRFGLSGGGRRRRRRRALTRFILGERNDSWGDGASLNVLFGVLTVFKDLELYLAPEALGLGQQ